MNPHLKAMLCSQKRIEAIYEVDRDCGGFATVVRRSDGTEELYPNCKVETVLDTLAAFQGKSLDRLRYLRGQATGKLRGHIDFYEISLSLMLMPVRYRKAFNSNHGVMAYLNITRLVRVKQLAAGRTQVQFLSGHTFEVRESAATIRSKFIAGREQWLDCAFARSEELHVLRITMRRLQRLMEGAL